MFWTDCRIWPESFHSPTDVALAGSKFDWRPWTGPMRQYRCVSLLTVRSPSWAKLQLTRGVDNQCRMGRQIFRYNTWVRRKTHYFSNKLSGSSGSGKVETELSVGCIRRLKLSLLLSIPAKLTEHSSRILATVEGSEMCEFSIRKVRGFVYRLPLRALTRVQKAERAIVLLH